MAFLIYSGINDADYVLLKMIHLAQEIWDQVTHDLPSFSVKNASQIFGFKFSNKSQAKHVRVWSVIFRDPAWVIKAREWELMPTLIGSNLSVYYNHQRTSSTTYMALYTWAHTRSGNTFKADPENFELFLKCLMPHSFDSSTHEIKFKCGITLNASEVRGCESIVVEPTKLLTYRSKEFRSEYLMWEDITYSLRQVDVVSGERTWIPAMQLADLHKGCRLLLLGYPDSPHSSVSVLDPKEYQRRLTE